MGSAFGVWNKMKIDMWFVLRSSDETGLLLKLPPGGHQIIRLAQGEIVTTFMYGSQEEAEDAIGAGERGTFTHQTAER